MNLITVSTRWIQYFGMESLKIGKKWRMKYLKKLKFREVGHYLTFIDEFDTLILTNRKNAFDSYFSNFKTNWKNLRKFWRSIISSFPPGFFTYYYIFPEFRSTDDDTQYFGINKQYPKRRRLNKEFDKLKSEFGNYRQLTKFDHVVRVNNITAAYIYVDLRLFNYQEHKQVRLGEKKLMVKKSRQNIPANPSLANGPSDIK